MKKMKLFLLAAMIFAAGSAFTTVKATEGPWVLAEDGETLIDKDYAINVLNGHCDSSFPESCEYTAPNAGSPDVSGPVGRYQY